MRTVLLRAVVIIAAYNRAFQCARHCTKCLIYVTSVNPHSNLVSYRYSYIPIWQRRKLRVIKVKKFYKVTQLLSSRARIWTQAKGQVFCPQNQCPEPVYSWMAPCVPLEGQEQENVPAEGKGGPGREIPRMLLGRTPRQSSPGHGTRRPECWRCPGAGQAGVKQPTPQLSPCSLVCRVSYVLLCI